LTLTHLSLYISIAKWMRHSICTDHLLWAVRSAISQQTAGLLVFFFIFNLSIPVGCTWFACLQCFLVIDYYLVLVLVLVSFFWPYKVQLIPEACISNCTCWADCANLERCCCVNSLTNCIVTDSTNVQLTEKVDYRRQSTRPLHDTVG